VDPPAIHNSAHRAVPARELRQFPNERDRTVVALISKTAGPFLGGGNLRLTAAIVDIGALIVEQMRPAIRPNEFQVVRQPVLKVDIQPVVARSAAAEIDKPDG